MSGARVGRRADFTPPALPRNVPLYRVHVGKKIYGPVQSRDFRRIPGFTLQTPVAPYGTDQWQPAYKMVDLQKYFNYSKENSFSPTASKDQIPMWSGSTSRTRRHGQWLSGLFALLLILSGVSGAMTWKVLKPAEKKLLVRQCLEAGQSLQNCVSSVIDWTASTLQP